MPPSAKEVIRALERGGWVQTRQNGSHVRLHNPQKPANSVTVAMHEARSLPMGTLHAILRSAGLTIAELEELMKS